MGEKAKGSKQTHKDGHELNRVARKPRDTCTVTAVTSPCPAGTEGGHGALRRSSLGQGSPPRTALGQRLHAGSPSSYGNPERRIPVPQLSRGRERLTDTECGSQRSPSCTGASCPSLVLGASLSPCRGRAGALNTRTCSRRQEKPGGGASNCSQRELWGPDAGSSLPGTAPTSSRRMVKDARAQESKADAGAMVLSPKFARKKRNGVRHWQLTGSAGRGGAQRPRLPPTTSTTEMSALPTGQRFTNQVTT